VEKHELFSLEQVIEKATKLISCGLYFLVKNNEIIYIGQSTNISARLDSHTIKNHSYKDYDKVFIYECLDAAERTALEEYYIEKFKPRYNSNNNSRNYCPPLKEELIPIVSALKGLHAPDEVAARYGTTANTVRKLWRKQA
jgi:excinuclease UvrABC nuclease subunit